MAVIGVGETEKRKFIKGKDKEERGRGDLLQRKTRDR